MSADAQPGVQTRGGWHRKFAVAGAMLLFASTGLGMGLGVGLTRARSDADPGAGAGNANTIGAGADTQLGRNVTWRPKVGASWQIILNAGIDVGAAGALSSPEVDVYDVDMYENDAATLRTLHEAGKRVVCYFSAGSYEDWRADKGDFRDEDLGSPLRGWRGERWLKLTSESVRDIMRRRVRYAADKGCDAIDPDNVDGYVSVWRRKSLPRRPADGDGQQNSNGLGLTAADSVSFVSFLADEAARYNMSVGLKNAGSIVPQVLGRVDFGVNEQCVAKKECATYAPFVAAGKPIFHIEYPSGAAGGRVDAAAAADICSRSGSSRGADGFSTAMKRMELDGWVEYCGGSVYETPTKKSTA